MNVKTVLNFCVLAVLGANLAGCAAILTSSRTEPPIYEVTASGEGNDIQLAVEGEGAILEVQSETGIGSGEVTLTEGKPPKSVTIYLHTKGLEGFTLRYADQEQQLSFSRGAHRQVSQSSGAGAAQTSLEPGDPEWLEATIAAEEANPDIPLESGYFVISLPDDLFQDGNKSFLFEWDLGPGAVRILASQSRTMVAGC